MTARAAHQVVELATILRGVLGSCGSYVTVAILPTCSTASRTDAEAKLMWLPHTPPSTSERLAWHRPPLFWCCVNLPYMYLPHKESEPPEPGAENNDRAAAQVFESHRHYTPLLKVGPCSSSTIVLSERLEARSRRIMLLALERVSRPHTRAVAARGWFIPNIITPRKEAMC